MISFAGVTARYAIDTPYVLADVTLDARLASITAVVGPNGSGKSSLVRTLLRRLPIERGEIHIGGRPLDHIPMRELAAAVAVITQREEPTFPMSVREYVSLGRYPSLGEWARPSADDRAAVEEAMEITEVAAMGGRRIDALSGGEWQRVRLARALSQGGTAVVLDEPTTFLDIAHEMAVFELLHHLARSRGQAVLLVSHQLNLVSRYADHMVLLHAGRVAAWGTPGEVMRGEILERVYQWPLVVTRDPAVGAPMLVPLRSSRRIP
jgi:iron complex transport system ATP-binding protein